MSKQSRRDFLCRAGALAVAATFRPSDFALAQGTDPARKGVPDASVSTEDAEALIRPHFVCSDPDLWRLTVEAYRDCILGKVRPAEPPLQHAWLVPGGIYVGQWLWDTMFVCDLLSVLPNQRDVIRGAFQNYWDFQKRWDDAMPEFKHGMISNFIAPDSANGKLWKTFPAYSQAPLLAWGMERVVLRNNDLELVRQGIAHLEAFHEWYWRERDLHNVGLVCVGSYNGDVQHARYETYDNEVDLDGLNMTVHPTRKLPDEGAWYGDICIPCNTAYLLVSELSLARLAERVGDHAMAKRRRERYAKGKDAMMRHMWDKDAGCFLAVHRDTLKKNPVTTVGGLTPLMALVPGEAEAHRMAEAIVGPKWMTPMPIPSVSADDKNYKADGFWRGDVWPSSVYQVVTGLSYYKEKKLVAQIADKVISNAIKVGISEHYDSQTGAALGVRGLGMSSVILTMALDGMSERYKISVRS